MEVEKKKGFRNLNVGEAGQSNREKNIIKNNVIKF
jgi:hypothetical protein